MGEKFRSPKSLLERLSFLAAEMTDNRRLIADRDGQDEARIRSKDLGQSVPASGVSNSEVAANHELGQEAQGVFLRRVAKAAERFHRFAEIMFGKLPRILQSP